MTSIWPVMEVIWLLGARPAHHTPSIGENDDASVSLLLTAAAVAVCKHREAAPARLSVPQHHSDENSWWECVHNTQRLLRITPPPQTHSHSFPIQNGRRALICVPKVFRREKEEIFKHAYDDKCHLDVELDLLAFCQWKTSISLIQNYASHCCATNRKKIKWQLVSSWL